MTLQTQQVRKDLCIIIEALVDSVVLNAQVLNGKADIPFALTKQC